MKELDLDKTQAHVNVESRYGDRGSKKSMESNVESLKILPSFMGDFEVKLDVKKVPTKYKPIPPVLDMMNLQALMSTPIKVTLPLADVLRVKLELWVDIANFLEHMGMRFSLQELPINEKLND